MTTKENVENRMKTIIPLPEGCDYRLADVFTVTIERMDEYRSLLTLQIVFFPPRKASLSSITFVIAEFLKTLQAIVFCELEKDNFSKHSKFGGGIWIFGPFASEWSQLGSDAEVEENANQIVRALEMAQKRLPMEFAQFALLRESHGEAWLEELARGQNMEKIQFSQPLPLLPLREREMPQRD
ncbi:MAG: hypothetical protein ACE5OZ_01265 [Candidatus Heimdallarchaeota archaeon]